MDLNSSKSSNTSSESSSNSSSKSSSGSNDLNNSNKFNKSSKKSNKKYFNKRRVSSAVSSKRSDFKRIKSKRIKSKETFCSLDNQKKVCACLETENCVKNCYCHHYLQNHLEQTNEPQLVTNLKANLKPIFEPQTIAYTRTFCVRCHRLLNAISSTFARQTNYERYFCNCRIEKKEEVAGQQERLLKKQTTNHHSFNQNCRCSDLDKFCYLRNGICCCGKEERMQRSAKFFNNSNIGLRNKFNHYNAEHCKLKDANGKKVAKNHQTNDNIIETTISNNSYTDRNDIPKRRKNDEDHFDNLEQNLTNQTNLIDQNSFEKLKEDANYLSTNQFITQNQLNFTESTFLDLMNKNPIFLNDLKSTKNEFDNKCLNGMRNSCLNLDQDVEKDRENVSNRLALSNSNLNMSWNVDQFDQSINQFKINKFNQANILEQNEFEMNKTKLISFDKNKEDRKITDKYRNELDQSNRSNLNPNHYESTETDNYISNHRSDESESSKLNEYDHQKSTDYLFNRMNDRSIKEMKSSNWNGNEHSFDISER